MKLRQREPRIHDAAHLAFVRGQPCCALKGCPRPSEAAHIRMGCPTRGKDPTGYGEKPHDIWTVPLCGYHHRTGADAQHVVGETLFWELRGIDPFALALRLWTESGGAARALEPKPAPRPRKIKARKPVDQRQKMQTGRGFGTQHRALQSRSTFERRT